MKDNPKLTIVTINFNNREGLRKTVESVAAQTTRDFEYIVIDGGSTDGSVEVIKEYAEYIDYWVSEPDKGIYNAMNKGVQHAHGLFCQFLNSGDWLYSNVVVECMLPYFDLDKDIWVGYTTVVKEDGRLVKDLLSAPKELTLHHLINCSSLSHQSSFIRTKLLLENPYNESLKIVSDWEFYIDAYLSDAKFAQIPFDVAYFSSGGISSTGDVRGEGSQKKRELIHPKLLSEIQDTPAEIISLFNQIPTSYRLKRLLCTIDKLIVKVYSYFKKTIENERYVSYPPPIMLKKQKKSYRSLR